MSRSTSSIRSVRKGFRFKGTATVYTSGEMYDRGLQILREQGSTANRERVRSIVVIEVTEAAELISPAYDDGATEQAISDAGRLLHRAARSRVAARMSALNDPCQWTQPMPSHSPTSTPSRRRGWSPRVRCRRRTAGGGDPAPRGRPRAERRHRRPLRPRPSAGRSARRVRRVAQRQGRVRSREFPFLLKDLGASLAGAPEAMGSRALRTHVATESAWIVDRYLAAGLVVFGKTNTPEWGNHCTTEPSLFGPTVNPWSPSITPGGSSGGSAAAFFDFEFATTGWTSLANVALARARSRCRSAPRRTVCRSEFRSWRPMRRSCSNSPHSSKRRSQGYIGGPVCNVAAWCATFVS